LYQLLLTIDGDLQLNELAADLKVKSTKWRTNTKKSTVAGKATTAQFEVQETGLFVYELDDVQKKTVLWSLLYNTIPAK